MAKKKPVDPLNENHESSNEEVVENDGRILSQEQAEEFVKRGEFEKQAPQGVRAIFVTTDGNAFWPKDLGACNTHCRQYKLKKFHVNF